MKQELERAVQNAYAFFKCLINKQRLKKIFDTELAVLHFIRYCRVQYLYNLSGIAVWIYRIPYLRYECCCAELMIVPCPAIKFFSTYSAHIWLQIASRKERFNVSIVKQEVSPLRILLFFGHFFSQFSLNQTENKL